MWSKQLARILESFYNVQERNKNRVLNASEKEQLVQELISAYNILSDAGKYDVLVPAKCEFLNDRAINADMVSSGSYKYEISYKWPPNDGFQGLPQTITLKPGSAYDRIGSSKGRYLSPVSIGGECSSYLARAIPYYIPEKDICDNPAYHRYKVVSEYRGVGSKISESVLEGILSKHSGTILTMAEVFRKNSQLELMF